MILGIFGNVGKFKTALATLIIWLYLQAGVPVYTNYKIDFPEYSHLLHKLSLSQLLELDVDFGVIVIDEVYTIAEARISMSKVNRFFSYFIFQSRKIRVHIIYTSQLTSAVDLRLFNLTDKKIACYGLQKDGTVKIKLVYDHNGKEKKKSYRISLDVFKTWIFNHYDTYEPIDPIGLLDLIVDIEKYEPEKLNKRIDSVIYQLKKCFKISQNAKKYEIEDCLLRIGYPSSLASYVANRLRNRIEPIDHNKTHTPTRTNSAENNSLLRRLEEKKKSR